MAWRYSETLDSVFDLWARNKSPDEKYALLEGLIGLADCPLTELPGLPRSAMPLRRWARLGIVLVSFYANEAQDVLDVSYLDDA